MTSGGHLLIDPDILPDSVHTPARPITFLLWSHEHRMWWRADARGYTPNQDQAGRYSRDEAVHWVVQSAHCGNLSLVTFDGGRAGKLEQDMTPLHAALDAAEVRDYGHCRELLAELSDEQVQAARVTYLAAAAQCDVVRYREPPAPSGVDGYKVGGRR